ncbi:SpoIIE family protein phosphatase [Methanoregula sp.]|uniref:SpoIIE family protein phosphatase n=1 Tax=Methanoregula sp. TaxID=2052170 RepID=UPI002CF89424|nr:SpoIIE family protein phosphatase [Methanoregula sp.]HVP97368.1 SpoIIE family protein phosphatase [Methanoregula sp.]
MKQSLLPRFAFTIRVKILILFLALSLAALAITGYFAFSAITNVGTYAQGSSQALGEGVINNSSTALLSLGEQYLLRVAADQANVTDVLFSDTDTEMKILAAQTAELQYNPPVNPLTPIYLATSPPANSTDGAVLVFAANATATPGSEEARRLSGLADSLKAVYSSDEDMTSVYIATDSGMMLYYPGQGNFPPKYDPRTRQWFVDAERQKTLVWSDGPYVDAGGNGLIMTCSEAIPSPAYGSWVIASDVSTDTINQDFIGGTLGGKGYAVLINQDGDIISSPGLSAGNVTWDEPFDKVNAFSSSDPDLLAIVTRMTGGKTGIGRVVFNGTEMYVAYAPVTSMNWSLAISLPVSQITQPIDAFTGRIQGATEDTGMHITAQTEWLRTVFAILFVAILLVVLLVSIVLSRVITRPVEQLKAGAEALGEGDLDFRVEIQSGDEFEDLARSFNSMAEALKENIENLQRTTAEKERYSKEMEIARSIQTSFLPEKMPEIPGYEISAVMLPAMEVGGDFYDIIPAADGKCVFVIADVSGKGVSAALFMAMSRTLLRAGLEGAGDPAKALGTANRMIAQNAPSSMFVTVFSAILDPGDRTLTCINAGHNPPVIVRGKSGECLFLREGGVAMGVLPEMVSVPEHVQLQDGDLVILYTDGVTEAFDTGFNAFGEGRLVRTVQECCALPASTVRDRIISEIRSFAGSAPQSDDITLIVIRVLGANQTGGDPPAP